MSKINNHGIAINKINLAIDLQELTCEQAAAIQGGARIILYEHADFQGESLTIDGETADQTFSLIGDPLNNKVSSFKVESGLWSLFSEDNQLGFKPLDVGPGEYSSVEPLFNDVISSGRLNLA
ncbi:MAG: hypothetical protein RLZZ574_2825 [Cyanobacteriota bacterium]|jgi:uncharacterized protein YlxW (UPF0749 family)